MLIWLLLLWLFLLLLLLWPCLLLLIISYLAEGYHRVCVDILVVVVNVVGVALLVVTDHIIFSCGQQMFF